LLLLCNGIGLAVLVQRGVVPQAALPVLITITLGLGAVYGLLGWWALRQPLQAAITGLLLYVGLVGLVFFHDPDTAQRRIFIALCVIILLVQAAVTAARAGNPQE